MKRKNGCQLISISAELEHAILHLLYSRFFTKAISKCNKNFNLTEPFKNLFTQRMVCHESYQDKNGNWLYPDEVTKIDSKNYVNKKDNSKVLVGPPESMSKSKKNTIDPETMINQYGADAVKGGLFLSDSPPKDYKENIIKIMKLMIPFTPHLAHECLNF